MPLRDPNNILVEEFMNRKPVTVQSDKPLLRALEMMRRYNIQDIPVVNARTGKLAGILDRRQLGSRRLITSTTLVEDLMSPPTRVSPNTSLPRVAEILLASDFRGLPVTYNNLMVGYISRRDVVKALPQMMDVKASTVEDVMSIEPVVMHPEEEITRAVELMEELGQRCLPVVNDHGKLTGVLGKKALESKEAMEAIEKARTAELSLKRGRSPSKKAPKVPQVGAFMNPPLIVDRGDTLRAALNHITKKDVSAVIVSHEEIPVGIISTADLLEIVASRSARSSVYVQISGLPLEESPIYDDMEVMIKDSMKRVARFTNPEMVTVHVVKHHGSDDEDKFTVRVRLNDSRRIFMTSQFDWDIMKALAGCLEHLEILVQKEQEKRRDLARQIGRKRKGR